MNIPLLFLTEHGTALVAVHIEATQWTELCMLALERAALQARNRAKYERARARHLASAERAYTTALLARLR
jgi:hypothetical protein